MLTFTITWRAVNTWHRWRWQEIETAKSQLKVSCSETAPKQYLKQAWNYCFTQCHTSPLHKGGPLTHHSKIGLEHAVVRVSPEHLKHAHSVTCLGRMQAMKELDCFQLPGIVYRSLKYNICTAFNKMHPFFFLLFCPHTTTLSHTCASNQPLKDCFWLFAQKVVQSSCCIICPGGWS